MGTTKDMNTAARMKTVALSEQVFESSWPHKWLRSGFSNPVWSDGTDVAWDLPKQLTAMPDYIARNGNGAYWVECVGCSGPQVTALKTKKLFLLQEWQEYSEMQVVLFVYNSKMKMWSGSWLDDLLEASYSHQIKRHSDGPQYWAWSWDELKEVAYLSGTRR